MITVYYVVDANDNIKFGPYLTDYSADTHCNILNNHTRPSSLAKDYPFRTHKAIVEFEDIVWPYEGQHAKV